MKKENEMSYDNAVCIGKAQGLLSSQEQAIDLVKQDISDEIAFINSKSTLRKLDMIQEALIEAQQSLEQVVL